ncbi:DoxX family protein [Notoacmeibacter sp. MSK16QG-6]|uniref:DoxX family protein n=1 Tax=Notoacmeibacter sp. MSK16QG-6 TaxID=2957982 RepID=UPI0020A1D868|nr:DoxX family protein [Notoacmeibacter sp. MSK16QG-6]MCP1198516.1 DoxX family protein [Notoacmeibacter sp. MSK16QG-6]
MADTLATKRANNDIFLLIGRVLAASLFIASGVQKLMGIEGTVGYIEAVGLPYPIVLAWIAAIFETAAGLLLLVGFLTRSAALALAGFCFFTAFVFHFQPDDPQQMTQLMKNIALAGGCLAFAAVGAGRFSVDRG